MKRVQDPVGSQNLVIPHVFQADRDPIHRVDASYPEEHPLQGHRRRVDEEAALLTEVRKGLGALLLCRTSCQAEQAAAEDKQAAIPTQGLQLCVLGEAADNGQKGEAGESGHPGRRRISRKGHPNLLAARIKFQEPQPSIHLHVR